MFNDRCAKLRMISPTGRGIRNDSEGHGYYRAKRGKKRHQGTDYVCMPKQEIVAPISGKIIRVAYPYKDKVWEGVVIQNEFQTIKMFYLVPIKTLIGKEVKQGDVVGFAQDISKKYSPKMIPHIHLEISGIDPNIFVRE